MSKKKNEETWPTEEEFKKDDVDCGLADEIPQEADCDECSGDCSSCSGCCDDEEDLADKYLRVAQSVQADFENYKKRNANAIKDAREDGRKSVIISILPCIDAIEKAIEMIKDAETKKGLELVAQKFNEVLKSLNVTKMDCLGKKYDANLHNVLASIESEKPQGEIIQVCINGYTLDGIVIRHAQVVVSK